MHIGFLFNHHGGHQVAHALPIAYQLRRLAPDVRVSVFTAEGTEPEVHRLAATFDGPAPDIIRLQPASTLARAIHRATGRAIPADTISSLGRNLDLFRDLDALVVPEKTSLMLKSRFGLKSLKIIHTRHGAGDRAIGFDKASGQFDLVLLSGEKIRDRLAEAGLLNPGGYAITGYPKFDVTARKEPPRLFDNNRPTVVYNPHPSPALSSWYRMGPQILDWFAASDRYNLIFAPHIMLFAKRLTASLSPFALGWNNPPRPDQYPRDHMLIDIGSPASLDMTYTDAADIYLGDASSQIYEFIRRPRPCIFLNPRHLSWQGNRDFTHWSAGPVVETIDELAAELAEPPVLSDALRQRQQELVNYSFNLDSRPSSERAAQAILEFLAPTPVPQAAEQL